MSQAGAVAQSGGGGGGEVLFLQGDTGGEVGPNGSGVINLIGGGTITVMGNAGDNTLTIANTGASWMSISSDQTLDVNTGYFCVSPGAALSLLLPPTSIQGDVISIALDGATSFSITQGAGQSILYGNRASTSGVMGSVTSTQQGDSCTLVCRVPNLRWVVVSSMGNLTVV
jgi:hypothetical protein